MKKILFMAVALLITTNAYAYIWGSGYNEGDVIVNKNKLVLEARDTPSDTPGTGLSYVYLKENGSSDLRLHLYDDTGTETEIGSGGGGGGGDSVFQEVAGTISPLTPANNFSVDSDALYYDASSDWLGIGGTPSYDLHIQEAGGSVFAMENTSVGHEYQLAIGGLGTSLTFLTNDATELQWIWRNSNTASDIFFIESTGRVGIGDIDSNDPAGRLDVRDENNSNLFGLSNDNGVFGNVMAVERATGEVGIGTSSPDHALDITVAVPELRLSDNSGGSSTGSGGILILEQAGGTQFVNHQIGEIQWNSRDSGGVQRPVAKIESWAEGSAGSNFNYGNLEFYTRAGSSSTYENNLEIQGNGDIAFDNDDTQYFYADKSAESIGIGTTSPATKLEIVGDLSVSQSLTANDIWLRDGTQITGSGSGATTDGGATTYVTSATDDFAVGGTDNNGDFFVDVSEDLVNINGSLTISNDFTLEGAFYVGSGAATKLNNSNVQITFALDNPNASTVYAPIEIGGTKFPNGFVATDLKVGRDATISDNLTVNFVHRTDAGDSTTAMETVVLDSNEWEDEDDGTLTVSDIAVNEDLGISLETTPTAIVWIRIDGYAKTA